MRGCKVKKFLLTLLSAGCLSLLTSSVAQAYEVKTIIKTEHFALNQVILGEHDVVDAPTQSSITGDIQTQNRLDKVYQSTTVIFPYGSKGFTGKINTPIEAVLTISNYDTGKDRIFFDKRGKYSTEAGLYFTFAQLTDMVNQKNLNSLLLELKKLPIVVTNVPVSATGFDKTTGAFYVTSVDPAIILDARIDDSVYFSKEDRYKLHDNCTVNLLLFTDRMIENIPFFISGRAALNNMQCKTPKKAPAKSAPVNNAR